LYINFFIGPTSGWIVIENGSETTKDSSPLLTIYSEGAAYMSFSGDGENWTEWINYDNSYQEFNIANGLVGTYLVQEQNMSMFALWMRLEIYLLKVDYLLLILLPLFLENAILLPNIII